MKRNRYLKGMLVLAIATVLCAFTYNQITSSSKQGSEITLKEYNRRISNQEKIVLAYFSADWCMVCAKIKPVIEEIERDLGKKVDVLRINADRDKEVTKEFEVDALPVLILYKNGSKAWVLVGVVDPKKLRPQVEAYI